MPAVRPVRDFEHDAVTTHQRAINVAMEAQRRCGVTPPFDGNGLKPARQGIYRVTLWHGSTYSERWAFFDIVSGWRWPQTTILGALMTQAVFTQQDERRIVNWWGLAQDPNPPQGTTKEKPQ